MRQSGAPSFQKRLDRLHRRQVEPLFQTANARLEFALAPLRLAAKGPPPEPFPRAATCSLAPRRGPAGASFPFRRVQWYERPLD